MAMAHKLITICTEIDDPCAFTLRQETFASFSILSQFPVLSSKAEMKSLNLTRRSEFLYTRQRAADDKNSFDLMTKVWCVEYVGAIFSNAETNANVTFEK